MATTRKTRNIDPKDITGDPLPSEEKQNTTENNEKNLTILITVDNSFEEIVEYEQKGAKVKFDPESLIELSDDQLEKLRYETAKQYWIAVGTARGEKFRAPPVPIDRVGDDPLRINRPNRDVVRNIPKGWHVAWKRPEEVELAKELGYKVVERSKDGKCTGGMDFPGASSTGSGKVILRAQSPTGLKDDLIAMYIDSKDGVPGEEILRRHAQAISRESVQRFKARKEELKEDWKEYMKKYKSSILDESNF